ncbi:glycosyltransferase family 24 protein [Cylindrobasidium torrendii FP15055 ss-10]|uniref:Glycosyltransferase family 24 protein n=1 Tax=Cylindrobasidium torrendii FP15055 ss-10 TaxID=1314674 RepID=A0A0D7B8Y4_9AGAR|nr:glycosyltransferase family 24 protein [Cylindrobasidium torrendii FP15055 ss-10]
MAQASPPVRISLRTSWNSPPPLVEMIETVALENADAFFPLVDQLTDPDTHALHPHRSAEALHQLTLEAALENKLLNAPGAVQFVEMGFAMHTATPKIEAFYQHYAGLTGHKQCGGTWVDWYGTVVCDVETLVQLAGQDTLDARAGEPTPFVPPKLLPFDHVYAEQRETRPPRTAILYASLESDNFRDLHVFLLRHAAAGALEYVFRHIPPETHKEKSYLSGFGVGLDLKKTDYLAVDDRNLHGSTTGASASEDASSNVDSIAALIDAYPAFSAGAEALTTEEIQRLGVKAVQLISDAEDPLDTLQQLSHNFPKYAVELGRRVQVNESLAEELHENQLKVQAGNNIFWLNGQSIPANDVTPLHLLRALKKERTVMLALNKLGFERGEAIDLLTRRIGATASTTSGMEGLVDASDRSEGGDLITWWNDFDTDSRYSRWTPSIFQLLRPTYPGQMPTVKLNLFNVVLALDLSQPNALAFLSNAVPNLINRNLPFRFGLVPLIETENGAMMARLFYFLVENFGRKKTAAYFRAVHLDSDPSTRAEAIDWNVARKAFEDLLVKSESEHDASIFAGIIQGKLLPEAKFDGITSYVKRMGASLTANPEGHVFLNGRHFDMDEMVMRGLQTEVNKQLQFLQEQIYAGSITDDDVPRMATYFYDLPATSRTRNRYITSNSKDGLKVSMNAYFNTGFEPKNGAYAQSASNDLLVTMVVAADFTTEAGVELVKAALRSLDEDSHSRITFVHNPSSVSRHSVDHLLSALGMASTDTQTPITDEGTFQALAKESAYEPERSALYTASGIRFLKEFGVQPGAQSIVINGRAIGPFEGDFGQEDFKALEEYEIKRIAELSAALPEIAPWSNTLDRASRSQLLLMSSIVLSATQQPDPSEVGLFDAPLRPRFRGYSVLDKKFTGFEYGDNSTALYQISAIIDPLSETAQRWASILRWISALPDVYVEVRLNPLSTEEIPLKRFYRSNLLAAPQFDDNGDEVRAETIFNDLPLEPIYTLAMEVPSAWLVRPRESTYDLDNIQLGRIAPGDSSVDATFELDYIVIEGHARDMARNGSPRGLQLQLLDGENKTIDDTLVMANYGYFQFKTTPGVFELDIREGRGRQIYTLESVGAHGWDSPSVEEVGRGIAVTSFEGMTIYPKFRRVPGMENVDVLDPNLGDDDDDDDEGGFVDDLISGLKSFFGTAEKAKVEETGLVPVKQQADINIFTVASGLLYERFVGIMIQSVMRHTNSTVKFWFIENFLSPSFLEFIPHYAEAYGFDYELVTYKWPSFLRAQKEKQRIIWAYKILFLDVLFPLDLKKVIFVDADQIVRTDLQELVDLDLHGAVYGYTPMGDDNTDMEGFRFWKTGYWKESLRGRPYHISALYVIDLVKFRQGAAGDILRGHYQALSADPNSLANLDQDLPNNLQREVPIFSLPEDWLWCETWCSKDRLHRAKTIDLCQNPLTKEPKLARARQIPEWEEYDREIAMFTKKLADEGKIRKGAAVVDINVLAGEPVTTVGSEPEPDAGRIDNTIVRDEDSEQLGGATVDDRVKDEL